MSRCASLPPCALLKPLRKIALMEIGRGEAPLSPANSIAAVRQTVPQQTPTPRAHYTGAPHYGTAHNTDTRQARTLARSWTPRTTSRSCLTSDCSSRSSAPHSGATASRSRPSRTQYIPSGVCAVCVCMPLRSYAGSFLISLPRVLDV